MSKTPSLALKVGIFTTIGIILMLALSLSVENFKFGRKTYDLNAFFEYASGLQPGTKVTIRGLDAGRVTSIGWDNTQLATRAVLTLDQQIQIPRGAYARVRSASLLGGNLVEIDFDRSAPTDGGTLLAGGDTIETRATKSIEDAVTQLANLGEQGTELFTNLDNNQKVLIEKVNVILDENRDDVRSAIESFSRVGPELEKLGQSLNNYTAKMERGEGTLGLLFNDRKLYDEFLSFSESANEITTQIRSGQGSLGKMVFSDEMANDMKAIFDRMGNASDTITAVVTENRESFARIVNAFASASENIEATMDNMEDISRKIRTGEGTIGKLVNDPSLFEDTKRAMNQIGESFEGAEEQGVIRSFFGLIFGALV